jgi:hypothetical protein
MKVGAVFPQTEIGTSAADIAAFARAAEDMGYDHVVAYDHVLGVIPRSADWKGYTYKDTFHEPLVLFGYLAAITRRLELSTGILVLPQRQTALVAKQAAEVDVLSGRRRSRRPVWSNPAPPSPACGSAGRFPPRLRDHKATSVARGRTWSRPDGGRQVLLHAWRFRASRHEGRGQATRSSWLVCISPSGCGRRCTRAVKPVQGRGEPQGQHRNDSNKFPACEPEPSTRCP